eukprot:1159424-Pelagomonas_calceolata.AAC.3
MLQGFEVVGSDKCSEYLINCVVQFPELARVTDLGSRRSAVAGAEYSLFPQRPPLLLNGYRKGPSALFSLEQLKMHLGG